jgi:hypothetical protein
MATYLLLHMIPGDIEGTSIKIRVIIRLGSYMVSSNGSFIKESIHWNNCIDYAIHEGNLPNKNKSQSIGR